jgi:cytochrome c-type biogenesis protein CcmH
VTFLLIAIFGAVVLAAMAFALWPALRRTSGRVRIVAGIALALFVSVVGAGTYLALGRPTLALRTLQGRDIADINGAVAMMVHHLRAQPGDLRGWAILGQAYMTARDGEDAAKAYQRAISLSQAGGQPPIPALYSNYGMALTSVSAGGVPDEAERAFRYALSLDPNDRIALFFLGQLSATRGRNADAVMLWQRLLGLVPADSRLHQELVDNIAHLTQAQGAAPDIGAMVAALAARLKQSPDDTLGWQRLVRAYAVLGDPAKAKSALADARAAMAKSPEALNALKAEAKELKLEN